MLLDHVTGTHSVRSRFFFNSLVDKATAAAVSSAGHGRVQPLVSIDGPRRTNDALRGPGNYDDVMASVANLLAVGLQPVANTVLVRPALSDLPQLARELHAAGVGRLHLILPHQRDYLPGDIDELVPTGTELLVALRRLLPVATDVGLVVDNILAWRRRLSSCNDFCAAGRRDLAIDPYGHVHACPVTVGDPAFVAGSLRKESLKAVLAASGSLLLLRAARARDRAECRICPVVDACGGECWAQAHYAARARGRPAGYAAPFPYCDLVRPILMELQAGARSPRVSDIDASCEGSCRVAQRGADYTLFDCI